MASRSGSLDFHSEDTAGRCCIQRNTACQSAHLLLASHSAYSSVEPVKNKQIKNLFEITTLPLASHLWKRRSEEAVPCPPQQEKESVRKLAVMGRAGKDIPPLDRELADTHHAFQIKDQHQILGSGAPPTLTDKRFILCCLVSKSIPHFPAQEVVSQ